MVESFGNIYTPELRLPNQDKKPSFVRTRATENCDLFGNLKPPAEETLKETPAESLNPDVVGLGQKFGSLVEKIKKGIDSAPQKAEVGINKLVNLKLKSMINPNPKPTVKFPVEVEQLTPKMKISVLKLYAYARKKGIKFTLNDGYRTEAQQEELLKTSKYAAKYSPHVCAMAIDIHIEGKTIEEAQVDLKKLGAYWKKTTKGRWGGDWYGKHHEPWHFDLKQKRQNLCLSKINKKKTAEGA